LKLFSLVLAVVLAVALAPSDRGTSLASSGPNSVVLKFRTGMQLVVSAPGTTYRIGTPVPITLRITNDSARYVQPIRWSCHQFAELHFVSASHSVANSTQDLGPAALVHAPTTCGTAIGWLRPHHVWIAHQEVALLQPHLAARLDLIVRNVDRPGTVDMPVFTSVLNFTLIRGNGK
jgi:hypothetical protein